MNRNDNDSNRKPRTPGTGELRDYAGVQHGAYGRYDEDDWRPQAARSETWGYGDFSAERGPGQSGRQDWTRAPQPYANTDAQRGDYRAHFGAERGHSRDVGYFGRGDGPSTSGTHGGYAETTGGNTGSGAYGHPRGRPGEDFRGRGPKNYVRTDERLRDDIADRLTADPQIDASDIEVVVQEGRVTLTGTVDRRQTRYRVEDLVDGCHGVREIDNRLGIGPAQTSGSGDATNRTPPRNAT